MAEGAAVNDLVASIASLLDLERRFAARLQEFASQTADPPEPLRSLSNRLPLLTLSLDHITRQTQAGHIADSVVAALRSVVDNATSQITVIDTTLLQITPPVDGSSARRAVKALQNQSKDGRIQQAVENIHQAIDFLTIHQTSLINRREETRDQALERLQLSQNHAQAYPLHNGHVFSSVTAHDHSAVHLGDVYHVHPAREPGELTHFGLCLAAAPLIDADHFVGRAIELEKMAQALQPGEPAVEQKRITLGGMGGVGKTQLAIAYARRYHTHYTSVLWLNATSETTLRASFIPIAQQLTPDLNLSDLEDKAAQRIVHKWLSDKRNRQWLLIFDNHDEPEHFTIGDYIPNTAQGSVIITTRLPDLVQGQRIRQVKVPVINDLNESLEILQTRSQRDNVVEDLYARRLAARLEGLPLALATAGAYLRKTSLTFEQYLQAYEERFNINPRRPIQLQEYRNNFYTTWNLSYRQIERSDPTAAEVLRLLAYFDNQEIWFELFQAGASQGDPQWLRDVTSEHIEFENVMSTLVDYCFLEVNATTRSYSMHSCVHDWALAELNTTISSRLYWYVFDCVACSVGKDDWDSLGKVTYTRVSRHGVRLVHPRFKEVFRADCNALQRANSILWVARLLQHQHQFSAAEKIFLQILAEQETAVGPNHSTVLDIFNRLGSLYYQESKREEAEKMYLRALAGQEKVLGLDHISTLHTVYNLGNVYCDQGKFKEAMQMMQRAIAGYEKSLGPDCILYLDSIQNLGRIYYAQGYLQEVEQMYQRALAGYEKTVGSDHVLVFTNVFQLGIIYDQQNRLEEAEQMQLRALAGREKLFGPDHLYTLEVFHALGVVYYHQNRLEEAEQMFLRALTGREKLLGPNTSNTLAIVNCLAIVYDHQNRFEEAEQMHLRALAGREKLFGAKHILTRQTVYSLSNLYRAQGKLVELIKLVSTWRRCYFNMSGTLGRALLEIPDESNAQIAFQYEVKCQEGVLQFPEVQCDRCDSWPILCSVGRFICLQCPDADLCGECWNARQSDLSLPASCVKHTFLKVSSEMISNVEVIGSNKDDNYTQWCQDLIARYSEGLPTLQKDIASASNDESPIIRV